jgi:capsular polysaccharide biosynthesis protein
MKIQEYIQAFIQGWWIVAASLLIGIGVAFLYSYSQSEVYEATATYLVSSKVTSNDPRDLIESEDTLAARSSLVNTYCGILESSKVVNDSAKLLGLQSTAVRRYQVRCSVFPDSNIMQVEVRGPSPHLATDLANAIGIMGLDYVSQLQEVYELRHLDQALLDTDPIAPDHVVDLTIGVVISGLGGVALVLLRYVLISIFREQTVGLISERLS